MTPAKPVRVPKALSADGVCARPAADDCVSPLTEMGSTPGSGEMMASTFRNVGAELQRAQGGARRQSALPKSASEVVGEIVRGADDETTVVGGGGACDAGEAPRAPLREEPGIKGLRTKLDQIMSAVGAVDERSRSQANDVHNMVDVVGALSSRVSSVETGVVDVSPASASREAPAEAPGAAEASVDKLMRPRRGVTTPRLWHRRSSRMCPRAVGGGDAFDMFVSIAPPRRGRSVPQTLPNPFDLLSGSASARSVASSISD